MKPRLFLAATLAAVGAVAGFAGAAQAQITVFDPSNYAKAVEEATTALNQLRQLEQQVAQGQQLLTSLNQNSGVNLLATVLQQPSLRTMLPDIDALVAAGRGDLTQLGGLASAAASGASGTVALTDTKGQYRGCPTLPA